MGVLNTESDISSLVQTIYDSALVVARERLFMDGLVTTYEDRTGLAPRSVTQYGTATVNAVGETDDVVGQLISRTVLSTLTPAEYAGAYLITDSRLETDSEQIRRDASIELGMAMADSIERNVISDFASLTGGTVGAAGSTTTWGHLLAAQTILRANNVPGPYNAVIHPYQYHAIAKAVSPAASAVTNAPAIQNAVTDSFFVGQLAGINIYLSSNVPIDGNADATGAVFSRQAIALDMRRRPRLEPERDASRRLWELTLSAVYAHGIWRPSYGVILKTDATQPTS